MAHDGRWYHALTDAPASRLIACGQTRRRGSEFSVVDIKHGLFEGSIVKDDRSTISSFRDFVRSHSIKSI